MNKEEIKSFLRSKPGYLKEGGKRLRKVLLKKGLVTTVAICKEAIREVNKESKEPSTDCSRGLKVLIYDIETSYNIVKSWRVGYNLNINPDDILHERSIICVSWKWAGEDKVYNLAWNRDTQCDKALLESFIQVMNEADMLVAHNGDRYDLKFIKTRALKHGIPMKIDYNQFDTLKVAKKKFMFNSNKLDYISKFLGYEGKNKTTMKLWDDIILHNSSEALAEMIEYCDEDVRQLENVYYHLVGWEKPKTHLGVLQGKTKQTSPITGTTKIKKISERVSARGTVTFVMLDELTGRQFDMSATDYKKFLEINQ
jgi:hypothetical protein